MPPADELANLRGIRLPPLETWYWADVGFAVALGLVAALLAALLLRLVLRPKTPSVRDAALAELAATKALPVPERRAAQAAVLRRIVRTVEGEQAARVTGPAWGATLDRTLGVDLFERGPGRVLVDGLYVREPADDPALDRALEAAVAKVGR